MARETSCGNLFQWQTFHGDALTALHQFNHLHLILHHLAVNPYFFLPGIFDLLSATGASINTRIFAKVSSSAHRRALLNLANTRPSLFAGEGEKSTKPALAPARCVGCGGDEAVTSLTRNIVRGPRDLWHLYCLFYSPVWLKCWQSDL